MKRTVELFVFFLGWVAVIVGLAQVYEPLAWIGGGMAMVAAALVSRRKA